VKLNSLPVHEPNEPPATLRRGGCREHIGRYLRSAPQVRLRQTDLRCDICQAPVWLGLITQDAKLFRRLGLLRLVYAVFPKLIGAIKQMVFPRALADRAGRKIKRAVDRVTGQRASPLNLVATDAIRIRIDTKSAATPNEFVREALVQ
jgi:hypothetical protein